MEKLVIVFVVLFSSIILSQQGKSMIEEKLESIGLSLPVVPTPLASYIPANKAGEFVYTSGQLPMKNGVLAYEGKVGKDISTEQATQAARICALNCLAAIKSVIGSLDNIVQIVKLVVFVNSAEGFTGQPLVANGASDLMLELFGENGKHARSAVGVSELPKNAAVEIEMIVRVK